MSKHLYHPYAQRHNVGIPFTKIVNVVPVAAMPVGQAALKGMVVNAMNSERESVYYFSIYVAERKRPIFICQPYDDDGVKTETEMYQLVVTERRRLLNMLESYYEETAK